MSIPFFLPAPIYFGKLTLLKAQTLEVLCQRAGIVCRATGSWTKRKIEIVQNESLRVFAEPGDWGQVRIETPIINKQQQARLALAVLAYGLHDLVAKQSVAGKKWLRPAAPRGRKPKARALTVSERQRRFREKKLF